ncbi:hypothetical protein FB192DRAFT_1372875 [Mucor lusitanicus]|uniref:Uncharacterized protein n=1 Tax=Mucor circinelloides f. lusitanicus TaxID=29924 RepID=A0A8H4BHI7_MUCCL|nr:hypothetical protein FB192DRAFT_1372875 [Mucor lusitanicus]
MLRVIVLLENHLFTSEAQFLDSKSDSLLQFVLKNLLIQGLVHVAIDLAHPTDTSVGNGTPKHDISTTMFYGELDMVVLELLTRPDPGPLSSI